MTDNIIAFPGGYNPKDIRGMAIEFAAKLKSGDYGEVTRAVILFESDTGLGIISAGEDRGGYHMIGLFEAAKMSVFADGDEE